MSTTGNRSTGYGSTGDGSTGDGSTGDGSTGDGSTGDGSTGNRSTGNWSTGNRSTGYGSTGDGSTGNWSKSNYSTGHFSTIDDSGFSAFNKKCSREDWNSSDKPNFLYFDLIEFIWSENMTDEEKKSYPSHETTKGYLKKYEYQEAFKKSWDEADEEDRAKLFKLPNFDAEIFKEISGIDVAEETDPNKKKIAELEESLKEIQNQINQLKEMKDAKEND